MEATIDKPDTTYNGWRNYETWAAALWMDNERGSYDEARKAASGVLFRIDEGEIEIGASFTREDRARLELADILKQEHEEAAPDLGASVFADLLAAAMSEIDWYEIASHLIGKVSEEA